MKSRTCIYCSEFKAVDQFNAEHVLPQALGRYRGSLTLNCVCEECNSFFGKTLDLTIGRDSVEALLRIREGLKEPSGVKQIRYGNLRLTLAGSREWSGAVMVADVEGGDLVVDLVTQAGLDFKEGGTFFLTLQELRRTKQPLKHLVVPRSRIRILHRDSEDYQAILRELQRLGISFNAEHAAPSIDVEDEDIANVSVAYTSADLLRRELCKLALNYLASQHGDKYVLKEWFDPIRHYVRFAKPIARPFFHATRSDIDLRPETRTSSARYHFFMLDYGPMENEIRCRVQLLGATDYEVVLTDAVRGIYRTDMPRGHVYDIDELEVHEIHKVRLWTPKPLDKTTDRSS